MALSKKLPKQWRKSLSSKYLFLISLLFHTVLLKCLIYSRVGISDSPWCNNSCRTYQELGQGDFYSFGQENVPFLLIYLLPSHKSL